MRSSSTCCATLGALAVLALTGCAPQHPDPDGVTVVRSESVTADGGTEAGLVGELALVGGCIVVRTPDLDYALAVAADARVTDEHLEMPGSVTVPFGSEATFGGGTVSAETFTAWADGKCEMSGDDYWYSWRATVG